MMDVASAPPALGSTGSLLGGLGGLVLATCPFQVSPCGICPWTACIWTHPCWISCWIFCWTSHQICTHHGAYGGRSITHPSDWSLTSWELKWASFWHTDSGVDSPGSFPGNSEEETAMSQVKDLWTCTSSFLARQGGGPCPLQKS